MRGDGLSMAGTIKERRKYGRFVFVVLERSDPGKADSFA